MMEKIIGVWIVLLGIVIHVFGVYATYNLIEYLGGFTVANVLAGGFIGILAFFLPGFLVMFIGMDFINGRL